MENTTSPGSRIIQTSTSSTTDQVVISLNPSHATISGTLITTSSPTSSTITINSPTYSSSPKVTYSSSSRPKNGRWLKMLGTLRPYLPHTIRRTETPKAPSASTIRVSITKGITRGIWARCLQNTFDRLMSLLTHSTYPVHRTSLSLQEGHISLPVSEFTAIQKSSTNDSATSSPTASDPEKL